MLEQFFQKIPMFFLGASLADKRYCFTFYLDSCDDVDKKNLCLRSSNHLVAHHPLVHVDYVVGVRDLEAGERDGDKDGVNCPSR